MQGRIETMRPCKTGRGVRHDEVKCTHTLLIKRVYARTGRTAMTELTEWQLSDWTEQHVKYADMKSESAPVSLGSILTDGSNRGDAVTRNDGAEHGDAVRRKLAHTDGV